MIRHPGSLSARMQPQILPPVSRAQARQPSAAMGPKPPRRPRRSSCEQAACCRRGELRRAAMAQRTLARMYDSYDDATAVVNALETSGIPHSEISLVANADAHGRYAGTTSTSAVTGGGDHPLDPADRDDTHTGAGAKRGAVVGGVLGGGA